MKPMIIDIAGTVKQLVKWVLTEALWFLGVILFGLSAPLLYTVGAWYLAWQYPQYAGYWATAYLFTGPIACTIWMLFIAPFGFDRKKLGFVRRHARYMGFGISGFLGSILSETVLTVVDDEAVPPWREQPPDALLHLDSVRGVCARAAGAAEPLDSQGRVRERLAKLWRMNPMTAYALLHAMWVWRRRRSDGDVRRSNRHQHQAGR